MKLFAYRGYVCGDHVAGFVQAADKEDAENRLRDVYDDYDSWDDTFLEEVEFDEDGTYEVYFGS